jgi:hypothetical protein
MSEDLTRVARRALATLPAHELRGSNIYLDPRICATGARVPVGRQTISAAQPSLLLFIDLVPGANWGHPCKYLLVGLEDGKVQEIDAAFPPPRENLHLLQRGEGAEDWTLLTRTGAVGWSASNSELSWPNRGSVQRAPKWAVLKRR